MEISLIILYIVFFISIILYIVAAILISAFVIPLQVEQAGVKNGLIWLRKTMLRKEFLSLVVIVASIVALTLRFFVKDPVILRYIITSVIFIHSAGTLGKAVYDRAIYKHQYSELNKEMHKRIEKMEISDAKKEAKAQK